MIRKHACDNTISFDFFFGIEFRISPQPAALVQPRCQSPP